MTERRTNRLIGVSDTGSGRTPPFVTVNDQQVPTDMHDYCVWLNARERRCGLWAIVQLSDRKSVEWREDIASDGWLQDRGLKPQIGRAA